MSIAITHVIPRNLVVSHLNERLVSGWVPVKKVSPNDGTINYLRKITRLGVHRRDGTSMPIARRLSVLELKVNSDTSGSQGGGIFASLMKTVECTLIYYANALMNLRNVEKSNYQVRPRHPCDYLISNTLPFALYAV